MPYTYDYPRPTVTVDILLFRYSAPPIEILLIQRKHPPFQDQWALPGGYVGMNERLIDAANRELFEETNVRKSFLFPITYADQPDRDPRGRTISFIFGGILSPPYPQIRAADDASQAGWYSVMNLPDLAFDHDDIIQRCWKKLNLELQSRFLIAAFLPFQFTLSSLERLFQSIYPQSNLCSEWLKQALAKDIVRKKNRHEFSRVESQKILYETLRFD